MDFFVYVAETIGVPVDQVIFLSTQIVSVILAVFFRTRLSPAHTSSTTRHVFGTVVGLMLLYWCYGWNLLHMIAQCLGVYAIMILLPAKINYKVAFVYAMVYLIYVQITRIRGLPSFSSPVMFATTKLTGLVFCIHDGVHEKKENLGPFRQKYAIREYPSLVEVFGYIFHFSGLICGPTYFFTDYTDFISGDNYLRKDTETVQNNNLNGIEDCSKNDLSTLYGKNVPTREVLKKLAGSILCAFVHLFLASRFPLEAMGKLSFINAHGFLYRFMYLNITVFLHRYRYYFGWLLGEAVQNASGLGLQYVNGKPQWNLTTNVNILKLDFVTSLKDIVDNWNMTVAKWLRLVVYERTEKSYRVPLTFALSSLWHGIEPGFFITATTCALFTLAAKKVRKIVRPHIVDTKWKIWYDIFTGLLAHVAISYSMGGFYLLNWRESYNFFTYSMYYWLHILTVLILVMPVSVTKTKEKST